MYFYEPKVLGGSSGALIGLCLSLCIAMTEPLRFAILDLSYFIPAVDFDRNPTSRLPRSEGFVSGCCYSKDKISPFERFVGVGCSSEI